MPSAGSSSGSAVTQIAAHATARSITHYVRNPRNRLVKNFGTTRALDGLDLRVETREVYGFLGPNGAGKTTTIRIVPHHGS